MERRLRWMGLSFAAAIVAFGGAAFADVKLPSIFSDNMVIQADADVPVWGTAAPGESVEVSLGGQAKTATAGEDGRWRVKFNPMRPSATNAPPLAMTVTGLNTVTVHNVLVGEVWLCSGQSNMDMPLIAAKDGAAEVAASDFPGIRMFTVAKRSFLTPQDDCEGSWAVCAPDTSPTFSAVGYFFARDLHRKLGVPVGMIHSSWSGSMAEPWIPIETLRAMTGFQARIETYDKAVLDYLADKDNIDRAAAAAAETNKQRRAEWLKEIVQTDVGVQEHWSDPAFNADGWKDIGMPMDINAADNPLGTYLGFIWMRKTVEVPAVWVGRDLTLRLAPIDDVDNTYVNGAQVGSLWYDSPSSWQTPRRYEVPAGLVTSTTITVVCRAFNGMGLVGMFGKPEEMSIGPVKPAAGEQPLSLAGTWKVAFGSAANPFKVPRVKGPRIPGVAGDGPACIYNGMIAPLVPYTLRGVIWYQGESNSKAPDEYRELLPALIGCWRKVWDNDFAFGIVQLANFQAVQTQPVEPRSWADMRDVQLNAARSVPNTGLAVAIDLGEAVDIHPKNKQEVGRRLALWARAKVYGERRLVYSGPLFRAMRIKKGAAVLDFDHAGKGLVAQGGELKGFAVAGADKVFHAARAEIVGRTVVVRSDEVPSPVAVRYAWANNPVCNLYNRDGLPASPFRTDDWDAKDVQCAPAAPAGQDGRQGTVGE